MKHPVLFFVAFAVVFCATGCFCGFAGLIDSLFQQFFLLIDIIIQDTIYTASLSIDQVVPLPNDPPPSQGVAVCLYERNVCTNSPQKKFIIVINISNSHQKSIVKYSTILLLSLLLILNMDQEELRDNQFIILQRTILFYF